MILSFSDPEAVQLSEGQVRCAVLVPDPESDFEIDGQKVSARYFAASADADDEQMHEIAFEIRNGRPMEPYQKWCREEAKALSA